MNQKHKKHCRNSDNLDVKENFIEIVPINEEITEKPDLPTDYYDNSFTLSVICSPNVCEMSNQLHNMTFKRSKQDEVNHDNTSNVSDENKLFKKPPCIEEIERQRIKFQKKRKKLLRKNNSRKLKENYNKLKNNSVNSLNS